MMMAVHGTEVLIIMPLTSNNDTIQRKKVGTDLVEAHNFELVTMGILGIFIHN